MRTPFGDLPAGYLEHASMSEQHDYLRARLSRRSFLKGAALAGLASAGPALWIQPARATGSTQRVWRHISFGADPRHEAAVSFATGRPFREAVVEFGPDERFGATVVADVRSVAGTSTRYGHGLLSGLAPGSAYRYRVRLDGTVTRSGTVLTAPDRATPFTFTAFGDEGVSAQARLVIGQLGRVRPAFHLLAGDICYANSKGNGSPSDTFDPAVWDRWLRMVAPLAENVPWMCATGNHEMEPGFGPLGYSGVLDRLQLPGNGAPGCPSTYTFRYGNVAFISLDSNDVSYEIPHNRGYSGGRQTMWLAEQLAALDSPRSGVDFVVVFFHHCAYSTSQVHGSEGGIRDHWVPLFDRYRVDLVINGHAHLYERSLPVRAGQVATPAPRGSQVDSSLGTTYITAGGGGAPRHGGFATRGSVVLRPHGVREPEPAPWAVPTGTTQHSFLAITVTPSRDGRDSATMQIRAIDESGTSFDQVTLARAPGRLGRLETPAAATWEAVAGAGLAAGAAWSTFRARGTLSGAPVGGAPGPDAGSPGCAQAAPGEVPRPESAG